MAAEEGALFFRQGEHSGKPAAAADAGEKVVHARCVHDPLDEQVERRRRGAADVLDDTGGLWAEAQLDLPPETLELRLHLTLGLPLGFSSAAPSALPRAME